VLNFATVAVLYLILGAPFISLVQITVYAGSIMVLFLFVIMLLGAERLPAAEPLKGQRWMAVLFGLVFITEVTLYIIYRGQLSAVVNTPTSDFASPAAIGISLFTTDALPFLVTGFILLAATIGAILLTRGEKGHRSPASKGDQPKEER
jgi:NADH-quinone oxidoreductase subunit J